MNLSGEDYRRIVGRKAWMDPNEFEKLVLAQHVSTKTLIVPYIGEGDKGGYSRLRLKIVNKLECKILNRLPAKFEKVEFGGASYYFGKEPTNLNHPHAHGIPVSIWGRDPKLTKLEVTYGFATLCLQVFGLGFGSRGSVPSHAMNTYCKKEGRGTTATRPSPAQDDDELAQQQYFRKGENNNMLSQPYVRRQLNELVTNAVHFGRECNNCFMGLVGSICTRQIITTGNVPKQPQSSDPGHLRPIGCNSPTYGFVNTTHIDVLDKLTPTQVARWTERAEDNGWLHCLDLLYQKDFCLPTTCGYQFTFKDDVSRDSLEVNAMFAMDGLGMAVSIEHGIGHHFMGAKFSHQTCLPVCRRRSDGKLSVTNHEDNFLLVGWGGTGGAKEAGSS